MSLLPASSFALDLYVDASRTGSATQDGLSWGTAYADLQDALAAASTSGTDIHIAEGVYYPDENEAGVASGISNNDPLEYFSIPTNVSLYGSYATGGSVRDAGTYVTVLSGDIDQNDTTHEDGYVATDPLVNINGTNSYTVVSMVNCSSDTILDGLVISSGAAGDGDGTIAVSRPDSGGGLYIDGGSPQFMNLSIRGNRSLEWGGGGIITGACAATFTNCYFSNNAATTTAGLESVSGSGGALYIDETDLTTGVSFDDCSFTKNTADSNQGGALRIRTNCVVSLDRCYVAGNSAVDGGGIYAISVDQLEVANSIIGGNYSSADGGGVFINGAATGAVDLINCTFSGNHADSQGGALYIDGTSVATMVNSVVWNNTAGTAGSGSIGYDGVTMTINYCLVEGESAADLGGTGNLDGTDAGNDPLFYGEVDPASAPTTSIVYFLYASDATSPIVGVGSNDAVSGYSYAIDYNNRIIGGTVDLGAYESSYYAQPELTGTTIDDIELAADPGALDLVDITSIFGGAIESYTFSFSVEHVVLLSFDGDTLRISPIGEAGESTEVTVTAVGPGGDEVSDTFTATLVDGDNESDDPLLSSWFTINSGKYARIFEDATAQSNGTTVTTWTITNNSGATTTQANPVYSDIQGIRYDDDFVYIEASGLSSYTMGPWASITGGTFGAYPVNQSYLRSFPRNPVEQSGTKDVVSLQASGLLVNGVAMWGAVDSSSWDGTELVRTGNYNTSTNYWHQTAPPAEAFNFDSGNGHQPPSGIYHVHQNPVALRYQLGDNVSYDPETKGYSEILESDAAFNGQHSPIIGWAHDGFPVYGPYGYDDASTLGGTVRRMVPGYVKRDGSTSGVDDVISNPSTLPAWYARFRQEQFGESYSTTAPVSRPTDTTTYPVGQFAEDWEHLSDVSSPTYTQGVDYDLDQYGGRFCKTPEYPDGIYAYFLPIDETGETVFPYIMGFEYYGDATGGTVDNVDGTTAQYFGGPHQDLDLDAPSVDSDTGEVTLVWNSVEGGSYAVLSGDSATGSFSTEQSGIDGDGEDLSAAFTDADQAGYARVTRSSLASYDEVLTSVPASVQTDTAAYGDVSVSVELDASSSSSVSIDLDEVFAGSYTYSASVPANTAISGWHIDAAAGEFVAEAPFGDVGDSVQITITATDGGSGSLVFTFTLEVVEGFVQADSLIANLYSWYTDRSSRYARLYESKTDQQNGNAVTTWSRGEGVQSLPVYTGPQQIAYSDDWVYINTPNLGLTVMGPWYTDEADTVDFPNYPANIDNLFRLPRVPAEAATKSEAGLGAIGIYVDGTNIFNQADGYSYDTSAGQDDAIDAAPAIVGDGVWNREAKRSEGLTVDANKAHQIGAIMHTHTSPLGLRYLLGDNVNYDASTNTYTSLVDGDAGFVAQHSPIIGWAKDGYPVYGPYGYDDPLDPDSGVRRMVTGFQLRDGSNGSTNLNVTGRTTLPQWAYDLFGRSLNLSSGSYGPNTDLVSATEDYSLGQYLEDYAYKGDLGLTQGVDFDLNVYNMRYCVTPEFPEGTYAYFNTIDSSGAEEFPYNVGVAFFGDPVGGELQQISETVEVWFTGGVAKEDSAESVVYDTNAQSFTVTYDVVEGGNYIIETTTDLSAGFTPEQSNEVADSDHLSLVYSGSMPDRFFHRISRESVAPYDDNTGGNTGGTATFDATFATTPPMPPENEINTAQVGGVDATITSYDNTTGAVTLSFDDSSLTPGSYSATLTFIAQAGPQAGNEVTLTSTNSYNKE